MSRDLHLAILAEQFVATFALQWLEGELMANDALDLLDHFELQLVLNFGLLNVKSRDWLHTHVVVDSPLLDHQIEPLVD